MPQLFDVARIGRDAELRYTPTGDPVLNLALACEYGRRVDGKYPTQWVEASLWGKQAEALAPYLLKGQQVKITVDDVHIEEYESQGVKRSKLVGKISHLKLVGSPPGGQQAAAKPVQQKPAAQPSQQAAPPNHDSFDDDIPFAPYHYLQGA